MNLLKMSTSELLRFLKASNISREICDILEGKYKLMIIKLC